MNIKRLVLTGARMTTLGELCEALVAGLTGPTVVLARLWVMDFDGSLKLTASAGTPTGGGTYNRLDGEFGRIAAGHGKIGRIVATREPFIVPSIRGDEDWLANPGWIARQGVRAFVGLPLLARGEVLGVLGLFERTTLSDQALEELTFLADYAAARIVDLRDRAEIEAQRLALTKAKPVESVGSRIVTRADLRSFEKQTIQAALTQTRGRIFGPRGAAAILEMKPTTLASRIKALRIR